MHIVRKYSARVLYVVLLLGFATLGGLGNASSEDIPDQPESAAKEETGTAGESKTRQGPAESSEHKEVQKPPIVDHFACSDYCPGPKERYMVKIYQGITDEKECRTLGGRPASYAGWGTFHICIAE